jgi:hypothetical protein
MRKVVEQKSKFRIVKRGNLQSESLPLECPLCTCVLIDEMDEIAIARSSCCFDCEVEVADRNREKWLEGWRPDELTTAEIKLKRLSSPHSR